MLKFTFEAPSVAGLGEEALDALRGDIVAWLTVEMDIVTEAMKAMVSRTGRVSEVGEAPSQASGNYAASWESDVKVRKRFVEGRLGSKLWRKYGLSLEFGNRRQSPRPHVLPVVSQWRRELNADIASAKRG